MKENDFMICQLERSHLHRGGQCKERMKWRSKVFGTILQSFGGGLFDIKITLCKHNNKYNNKYKSGELFKLCRYYVHGSLHGRIVQLPLTDTLGEWG